MIERPVIWTHPVYRREGVCFFGDFREKMLQPQGWRLVASRRHRLQQRWSFTEKVWRSSSIPVPESANPICNVLLWLAQPGDDGCLGVRKRDCCNPVYLNNHAFYCPLCLIYSPLEGVFHGLFVFYLISLLLCAVSMTHDVHSANIL